MYGKIKTRQLKSGLPALSRVYAGGNEPWRDVIVDRQSDLLLIVDALAKNRSLPRRSRGSVDQRGCLSGVEIEQNPGAGDGRLDVGE